MAFSTKRSFDRCQSDHLFTYGTLQPGHSPDEIAGVVRDLRAIGKGFIPGTLYDLGSYPGAVLDPKSPRRIAGTVFRLPEDRGLLRKLDEYEEFDPEFPDKSLFVRRLYPVQMVNGKRIECWVYEFNGVPSGAPVVESGAYGLKLATRVR